MKFLCKHCGFEHQVQPSEIDQQINCAACGRLNIIPSAKKSKKNQKNTSYTRTIVCFEPGVLFTSLIVLSYGIHITLALTATALCTVSLVFLIKNPVNSLPFFSQYTALRTRKFASDQYLIPLWFLLLISRIPDSNFYFLLVASISFLFAALSAVASHSFIDQSFHTTENKLKPQMKDILAPFYRKELIEVSSKNGEEKVVQTNTQLKIKNKKIAAMDMQSQVDQRFNTWLDAEVDRFNQEV